MTARQTMVLDELKAVGSFGTTAASIAYSVDAPEPSIRRTIQELIRLGHNISYAADGIYRYRAGY